MYLYSIYFTYSIYSIYLSVPMVKWSYSRLAGDQEIPGSNPLDVGWFFGVYAVEQSKLMDKLHNTLV